MPQTNLVSNREMYSKLSKIQMEVSNIKLIFLKQNDHEIASTRPISLEGIWKGVDITEEDIKEAKESLFPEFDDI